MRVCAQQIARLSTSASHKHGRDHRSSAHIRTPPVPDMSRKPVTLLTLDDCSAEDIETAVGTTPQLRGLSVHVVHHRMSVLPECIGQLARLKMLLFADNFRITHIPDAVFPVLSQLVTLDLRALNVDNLPDSIGNLTHLKTLRLRSLHVSTIPGTIGRLRALETLTLEVCRQLSELPESIGQLGQLRRLGVDCCRKLQTLPESIDRLSVLCTVDTGNMCTDRVYEQARHFNAHRQRVFVGTLALCVATQHGIPQEIAHLVLVDFTHDT